MLRRLWLSMRRDNRINLRNHYYTVVIAVAVLYLAAILWLIPEETNTKHATFVVDQTVGSRVGPALQQMDTEGRVKLLGTADELRQAMRANINSVGLLFAEAAPLPKVQLFFQGHENEKLRNLLAVSTEAVLRELYRQPWPGQVAIQTETLRAQVAPAKIAFNAMLVPIFLFTDAAMIGLLFIAALMFMEREDRTLLAYMVTPGRVWEYLLSKALTLAFLAVLFTLILVPPVLGLGPNYLHLLALMAGVSILTSLAGAWLAVYFENLTTFLFPAITAMVLLSLPAASYMVPSFSPLWLRVLPTYPVIFGLREALWPTGNPGVVYSALGILLAVIVAVLFGASWSFRRQMARA